MVSSPHMTLLKIRQYQLKFQVDFSISYLSHFVLNLSYCFFWIVFVVEKQAMDTIDECTTNQHHSANIYIGCIPKPEKEYFRIQNFPFLFNLTHNHFGIVRCASLINRFCCTCLKSLLSKTLSKRADINSSSGAGTTVAILIKNISWLTFWSLVCIYIAMKKASFNT